MLLLEVIDGSLLWDQSRYVLDPPVLCNGAQCQLPNFRDFFVAHLTHA